MLQHLAAAAMVVATAVSAAPDAAPPAPGPQVLLLTWSQSPHVERVLSRLRSGGYGDPPLPPLRAEWQHSKSPAEAGRIAAEVVARHPDLRAIYTLSHTVARGVQQAVPTVPIITDGVDDPLKRCLVDSHLRPGRNGTGYMHVIAGLQSKLLESLSVGFPDLKRVVVLVSAMNVNATTCDVRTRRHSEADCQPDLAAPPTRADRHLPAVALAATAQRLGLEIRFALACNVGHLESTVRQEARVAGTGFLVPWHDLIVGNGPALVDLIESVRAPAAYSNLDLVRRGGLLGVEAHMDDEPDRPSVLMLYEVLNGGNPATMPVQSPRRFTLVVNAAAAKRSGLRPSLDLLRRADKVLLDAAGGP